MGWRDTILTDFIKLAKVFMRTLSFSTLILVITQPLLDKHLNIKGYRVSWLKDVS